MISKDDIDVHGEAGHVVVEEIDGCSSFHGESAGGKDFGSHIQEQPDGIEIATVHDPLRMSVVPLASFLTHREAPATPLSASLPLAAQGSPNSSAHWMQSLAALI